MIFNEQSEYKNLHPVSLLPKYIPRHTWPNRPYLRLLADGRSVAPLYMCVNDGVSW